MATGTKRKKPPSVKQLRARAKFVKMVRARARAAKAAKRAAGIRTKRPATKRATVKKRATTKRRNYETASSAHPISVRHYYRSGGPGYMSAWKRAESRGQQRLFKMNPGESVKVRRNGVTKKLYGAAAQAILRSRAKRNGSVKSPTSTRTATRTATDAKTWGNVTVTGGAGRGATTRVTIQAPGKKRGAIKRGRNGIFRTAARQAISKRLHAPVFKRRRNQAPAGIEQMHEKFLGRSSSHAFEIVAPSGTPKDCAVLGELTKLKTEDEDFIFDKGEAYLGADAKGNLYVLGDVQVENNTSFGELEQICYLARKDHLEANPFRFRHRKSKRNPGTLTEYYHDFNEDGNGRAPKLKSDMDGMLHIQGGTFTIEPEGITG